MDTLNKKISEYYDKSHPIYKYFWYNEENLAMHYGLWDSKTSNRSEALINTNRVMANIAKIKENEVVLDAGCEVGGSSIWLAKNLKTRNVGISISKIHIQTAKSFVSKFGLDDKVKFYLMNFTKTRFSPESFDVVWATESMCHASSKFEFVSEANRVLKKGGRLIVCDAFLTKNNYTEDDRRMIDEFCEGFVVPNVETKKRFIEYLRKKKFKNIKFFNMTRNVLPSAKIIHDRCKIALPIAKILVALGIYPKVIEKTAVAGIRAYELIKKKAGVYGIFYAEKGLSANLV